MKKKIVLAAIAAALISGVLPASAAALPGRVEISFKVGDSTLKVNGETMQVTAPYITGDGTTLVPIRVITEAFGAEVTWSGDDRSVNLQYPDVNITIKIGSKSAVVNDHNEELLAAPEIHEDTTMVPLRFISETFGAQVDYNDGYISVIKENKNDSEQSMVTGVTDKEYIGDSYLGWTIKNPKLLTMTERSFDGYKTVFSDDDKNLISIMYTKQEDDIDIDEDFNLIKDMLSGSTISIADRKQLSNGYTQIHFHAKNKDFEYEIVHYLKGNMAFSIMTRSAVDSDIKDELFDISASFSITEKRDFYDLSTVKNGTREFKNEDFKLSLTLDAQWHQIDDTQPNEFLFSKTKKNNNIAIGIYSKSETVTAKQLGEHDRDVHIHISNPKLTEISELEAFTLNGNKAYKYTEIYKGFGDSTFTLNDTFVELGDYVYNISVRGDNLEDAEKIINTLHIEELDTAKVGKILRSSDIGTSTKVTFADGKVSVNSLWTSVTSSILLDNRTGATITASTISSDRATPKEVLDALVQQTRSNLGAENYGVSKALNTANGIYYTQTQKFLHDNYAVYVTHYTVKKNNQLYAFSYTREDIYFTETTDNEVFDIIDSLEI